MQEIACFYRGEGLLIGLGEKYEEKRGTANKIYPVSFLSFPFHTRAMIENPYYILQRQSRCLASLAPKVSFPGGACCGQAISLGAAGRILACMTGVSHSYDDTSVKYVKLS
jgi:hypothetical protein